MKATGMIRRMDELGRVVIPKEIRRTMHLKEGEELEIFAQEEGLFLKKYSAMETLRDSAVEYVRVVERLVGNTVLVADAEHLLVGVGRDAALETDKPLSAGVLAAMGKRKGVFLDNVALSEGGKLYPHAMVCPVVVHGDLFGAIVLGSHEAVNSRVQGVVEAACCLLAQEIGE